MHEPLVRLYQETFGSRPAAIVRVAADGSARTYRRLVGPDGRTVIGAVGPDPDENRAFLAFSRTFRSIGLPVPEIYADDEAAGAWLGEDLGDTTLFDALLAARRPGEPFPDESRATYRAVLEILPRFQVEGARAVDFDLAYPHAAFDRRSILWDLNYFKYHFLKLAHVPFHEGRMERDFEALADHLLEAEGDFFLYRDFQSRNVMLRDGAPWFIDYQGGRRGALQYDVASLLYDAKADLPQDEREALLVHYLATLSEYVDVDEDRWRTHWPGYVLVRALQALGAYGYRGFFERKPRFLESVPYAARNLERILAAGLPVELPEIEAALGRIIERWGAPAAEADDDGRLTLRVTSFSYRHGYPDDPGGHGGGFVFDCRALPNPGRLEEYRGTTGLDDRVAAWLERGPEMEPFWTRVAGLLDAQVEAYLARGFTALGVGFGCTGGQHRSVYLAERLARHVRNRFPQVRVVVEHREAATWPADAARPEPAPRPG